MGQLGYVYALTNPSMPHLVKIGKTTRSPAERARELSGNTNIPTPFSVIYYASFDDCAAAEKYIHRELEEAGYRPSKNREFFEITVRDAVDIIRSTEDYFESNYLLSEEESEREEWYEVYEAGLFLIQFGQINGAGSLQEAAELGCPYAHRHLGRIICNMTDIDFEADYELGIQCLKKGLEKGDYKCWAELAVLANNLNNDGTSISKYWGNYFSEAQAEPLVDFMLPITDKHKYLTNCFQIKLMQ